MTLATIEIHEFSTGIKPQRAANGWVSLGFTGKYMNVTIDPVPYVIERSIANREFAVAEGAASDKPAVIGRVLGTGNETFSVLAIVTRGRDEKGRSASMYRYFFTQGTEQDGFYNLQNILAWWESQQPRLIFNPFDIQQLKKPHIIYPQSPKGVEITTVNHDHQILSPAENLNLQSFNTLALRKYNSNKNGLGISWAYNVEALEKPERFLVIKAASEKAYQILQQAISRKPLALAPVRIDEEGIKSAIRGLMNSSQVKPGNVQIIAEALQNEEITSEYWHTLFNGQGAKQAIQQKINSPQMVRLITLRAVVIPETMLEFLGWLNIKPGQKTDDTQNISLEFQKAIREDLPKDKLANSIKFLLPELLDSSSTITPEGIVWLLKSNDSVWASSCNDFVNDIAYDLQLITKSLRDNSELSHLYKCDSQVWTNFNKYKKLIYSSHANHKVEEYTLFAKLFEQLREDSLAAYFYQVSQGVVPKELFQKVVDKQRHNDPDVFGLTLKKEVHFIKRIIESVKNIVFPKDHLNGSDQKTILKSAIRDLIHSSQIKSANVEEIANALQNEEITSEDWQTLFNNEKIQKQARDKKYIANSTRIMTLRAIVIPETVLEFLDGLNINSEQKPDEAKAISLKFQKAIRKHLPKDKLANSIKFLLPELFKKSSTITPEGIVWLLRSNDSVWASSRNEFVNDVFYDLQLIVNSLKTNVDQLDLYKCDPQIWKNLNHDKHLIYSDNANHTIEEYTPFAKLFEQLREYELAAYFYQVSQGRVPKKIFYKVCKIQKNDTPIFINLQLHGEGTVTILEKINYSLPEWRDDMNIKQVIAISVCVSIVSFTGGLFLVILVPSN
ncbi:MAG: hypothetical protein F6K62_15040, partial [Sphaerospermopsis sp. SIO1G2]|nr:hypothetical protein [Sphaerospermopsis sp. SIO1G2]